MAVCGEWILASVCRGTVQTWSSGSPAGVPLTGPGGVLMGTDDGGVDRDDPVEVAVGVGPGQEGGEDPLPGAVGGALPRTVVGALPRAEVLGQVDGLPARYLNAIASITCR
ncbi:hypothetical protein ADL02_06905 [Streptomyces sp. NRRL WC-3723]|nr:hypothetical protein ADL02_06905 [Streptomyces sp. NRRL WC-3723]